MTRRPGHAALVAAGVVVLLLVLLVSARGESSVELGPGLIAEYGDEPRPETEEVRRLGDADENVVDQDDVRSAVVSIGLLVVLLVGGTLVVMGLVGLLAGFHVVRRPRSGARAIGHPEAADDEERQAHAVGLAARRALDALTARRGGDPGDAVVRAWLALEDAVAAVGARREPHQTPTEFTAAVLTRRRVDEAALGDLLRAYQRARFSSRPVSEADVAVARDALARLVADLEAVRA